MFKKTMLCAAAITLTLLTGCASVPMESAEKDQALKSFTAPASDKAGIYIFRDSSLGPALKKTVKIDGETIGETATHTYFYRLVNPGRHVLATESEFGDNTLELVTQGGHNYYVRQSIKLGVFVGGAKLTLVPEAEGKQGVRDSKLAQ